MDHGMYKSKVRHYLQICHGLLNWDVICKDDCNIVVEVSSSPFRTKEICFYIWHDLDGLGEGSNLPFIS